MSMIEVIFKGKPDEMTKSMPVVTTTTKTETMTETSEVMPTTSNNLFTTYYVVKQ